MGFTLDVAKFARQFDDGAEAAIRGTTIKLFSEIIRSTPVDEGRARGNWFATGQQPSTKTTNKVDISVNGKSTTDAAQDKILSLQNWSTFTLTNNLPYIEKLEFGGYNEGPKTAGGYSKQAPAGMVRVNIGRFNYLLEQEAKKALPR